MPGVGIGNGKITLSNPLEPSSVTELQTLTVYNNGDRSATYEMELTLNETQPQLKPDKEWAIFSPKSFTLNPGGAQQVTVTLKLPRDLESGNYFSYLEAHVVNARKADNPETSIGAAAAAKFSFSVTNTQNQLPETNLVEPVAKVFDPISVILSKHII